MYACKINKLMTKKDFFFFVFRMLVNERAFNGTSYYLDTYRHLLASRGNIPWLSAIPVPRFRHQFLYRLLYLFHMNDLCFYFTGSLVYHAVGDMNSFGTGGIFMVMTKTRPNIVNLIFQKSSDDSFLIS